MRRIRTGLAMERCLSTVKVSVPEFAASSRAVVRVVGSVVGEEQKEPNSWCELTPSNIYVKMSNTERHFVPFEQSDVTTETLESILLLNKPVGYVDSENYMLGGGVSRIHSVLRHIPSILNNYNVIKPQPSDLTVDMPVVQDNNVVCLDPATAAYDTLDAASNTTCARVISGHAFFCTCNVSCCCMCGTFCSLDCHACFHKPCAHVTTTVCQKDEDVQPRVAVDTDKVSSNIPMSSLDTRLTRVVAFS